MATIVPKSSSAFFTLLRADFAILKANRRSAVLAIAVPVIILISWKGLVPKFGGAYVLSGAITFGLMAIGLMGYSITVARDRDKGIFQRLRVAPVPTWAIMASRLTVQLFMIMVLSLLIFILGNANDGITLQPKAYVFAFFVAILGGAVYLALGQLIVGLIKNPETVNATSRLVYMVFILVGMLGELKLLDFKGKNFEIRISDYVHYSPYGAVKMMLAASMAPDTWSRDTTTALLLSIGYAVIFAAIGIKMFKWNTK
ncbi:ABC transporter permease [Mucilaginibacter ginkgonis]|uniref:ABC transporter permease n=1 Tax=Mucilaginibacter ginkgonis TaxID=2682091 RepID=A0A6I4I4U4_9SPHI|nr:ABC transporter permease [Mucilaginibacter ginkgonis]QQL49035.1 ABC transporter permease [Mucilaginibacter ginkgonis]